MYYFKYKLPYSNPKTVAEAWINDISKAVYKGIYESKGLIEFDNKIYRDTIKYIGNNIIYKELKLNSNILEISNIKFYKYTLNENDLNLSWLKHLDIYICNSSFECTNEVDILRYEDIIGGNSLVFDETYPLYYKENEDGIIEYATILLITSFKDIDYTSILFHEITHLFDNIKLHYSKKDILYSNTHWDNNIDLKKYKHELSVIFMNIHEIYKVIVYLMYYCNISESHAFRENMYAEIQNTILSKNLNEIIFSFLFLLRGDSSMKTDKERLDYFISGCGNESNTLYTCFNVVISLLKYLSDSLKQEFDTFYSKDIKLIYGKFSTLNRLLQYYYKTLKKSLSHNRMLLKTILDNNKDNINQEYYGCLMNLIDNN